MVSRSAARRMAHFGVRCDPTVTPAERRPRSSRAWSDWGKTAERTGLGVRPRTPRQAASLRRHCAPLDTSTSEVSIRPATLADLPNVAVLAGALVRMHHEVDPARFFLPDRVEEGYAWWFERELAAPAAVILVATVRAEIVGYVYGRLEERDWNALLDEHGAIHDIFVAVPARRQGISRKLLVAMVDELTRRGAARVVLSTMVSNEAAQRLFASCGFRPTMLEMTRSR